MIAVPITLLALLVVGVLIVVFWPELQNDWRVAVFAVVCILGAVAVIGAFVGLILWIEAWS